LPATVSIRHTHFTDTLFHAPYFGCSVNATDRNFTFGGQVFSRFAKLKVQRLKGEGPHPRVSFRLMNPLKRIPGGGSIQRQLYSRPIRPGGTRFAADFARNHVTPTGYSSLRE